MILAAFIIGGLTVCGGLFAIHYVNRQRFLNQPNANWSQPGLIPLGTLDRFNEGLGELFPTSPARSYICLYRFNPKWDHVEETKFFIRSAGKKAGVHTFQGELRLSSADRDHAINAIPMLESIGTPLEREDKSYGLLALKTVKTEDIDVLAGIAQEFAARVLGASDDLKFSISWHIAGANSKKI
jgi:hypothetical protein